MDGKSGETSGKTGKGSSSTPMISREEYEALKKQNKETSNALAATSKALKELTALVKGMTGQDVLPIAQMGGTIGEARERDAEGQRNAIQIEPINESTSKARQVVTDVVNAVVSTEEEAFAKQQPTLVNNECGKGIVSVEKVKNTDTRRTKALKKKKFEDDRESSNIPKTYEEMRRMLNEMLEEKKLGPSEETVKRSFPFVAEITIKPLPKHFQMPTITPFNGKGNPKNHIRMYEAMMGLHGLEDAIMCRAFPVSLTDRALEWFENIPDMSISSYSQLRNLFLNAFAMSAANIKDSSYLLTLRRGEQESLRNFVSRFHDATLDVYDLQLGTTINAMVRGSRNDKIQELLSWDTPNSLAEIMAIVHRCVNQDEYLQSQLWCDQEEYRDRKRCRG